MSNETALELAREVMSVWGQPSPFLSLLTENVVIIPSVVIDEATVRGAEGVRQWLAAIAKAYDVYEVVADEFEVGAAGKVLVVGSIVLRPKGVHQGHVRPAFWIITTDGDKVSRIASYADEADARDAAGIAASD